MINPRHFTATDHSLQGHAQKITGEHVASVSAVEAGLSTADRAFAYMSNSPNPTGTPQAAGAHNRGSGKFFGTATPVSGK